MPPDAYLVLFAVAAFILGACIGSFLNVCIYRLPRDLSVNNPKRSFCPHCQKQIKWHHNLPLISWLALRGKCARCGAGIPFRYFGVELLTALLFLAVWLTQPWVLAFPYYVLISLLIVATFIDFDFFIIPDEITWGGVVAGLTLSLALPMMMGVTSPLSGLLWSLAGAATGYFLLWGVVEAGKLAFGKKRLRFDKPATFTWHRRGDEADVVLGDETMKWSDLFAREKDQLILKCTSARLDSRDLDENPTLLFHYNKVECGTETWDLEKLDEISAQITEVIIPREAMGFGDVKFIAAIGAFLGWKAVLFTVMAGSITGAAIGLATIAIGQREYSAKIPFGPYLALGALLWIFFGPELIGWYLGLFAAPDLAAISPN